MEAGLASSDHLQGSALQKPARNSLRIEEAGVITHSGERGGEELKEPRAKGARKAFFKKQNQTKPVGSGPAFPSCL